MMEKYAKYLDAIGCKNPQNTIPRACFKNAIHEKLISSVPGDSAYVYVYVPYLC